MFSSIKNIYKSIISLQKNDKLEVKLINKLKVNKNIITDKTKLKQILINLLSNALKFTDEGSIEIEYSLEANNMLLFSVKDTGIGLPEEDINIIFDRFRQANHQTKIVNGGTGLGLSISKAFVELLGGEIWVESTPHKGSAFYFTLPYQTNGTEETKELSKTYTNT